MPRGIERRIGRWRRWGRRRRRRPRLRSLSRRLWASPRGGWRRSTRPPGRCMTPIHRAVCPAGSSPSLSHPSSPNQLSLSSKDSILRFEMRWRNCGKILSPSSNRLRLSLPRHRHRLSPVPSRYNLRCRHRYRPGPRPRRRPGPRIPFLPDGVWSRTRRQDRPTMLATRRENRSGPFLRCLFLPPPPPPKNNSPP